MKVLAYYTRKAFPMAFTPHTITFLAKATNTGTSVTVVCAAYSVSALRMSVTTYYAGIPLPSGLAPNTIVTLT
jgi:hypothetical protein